MNSLSTYNTELEFSASQLADMLDIHKSTFFKKKDVASYFVRKAPNPNGRGRSVELYSIDCLQLCKGGRDKIMEMRNPRTGEMKQLNLERKTRDDKSVLRKPKAWTQAKRNEFEKFMRERSLFYFVQNSIKNMTSACRSAARDWCGANGTPEDWVSSETMSAYFKKNRVDIRNASFTGFYHKDNWEVKFLHAKDQVKFMSNMPHSTYDYIDLFYKAGFIKQGFGAGQMWFIDGSKFDTHLSVKNEKGKRVVGQVNYATVTDAIFGFPIAFVPIKSESVDTMIDLVIAAYEMVGVPRFGVVVDNSSAFKSAKFKGFMRTFRGDKDTELFDSEMFKALVPGQKFLPLIYPVAGKPTYPFKGKGERMIGEMNKLVAKNKMTSLAWQADRNRRVRPTENNQITDIQKLAPDADVAWRSYLEDLYGEFLKQSHAPLLTFQRIAKDAGVPLEKSSPNLLNAFEFFGGFDSKQRLRFPEHKAKELLYFMTEEESKNTHRVNSSYKMEYVKVVHKGKPVNYHCEELGFSYMNEEIVVIVDQFDDRTAYLYLEYDEKRNKDQIKEKFTVHFIGIGRSTHIDSPEALYNKPDLTSARNRKKAEIEEMSAQVQSDGQMLYVNADETSNARDVQQRFGAKMPLLPSNREKLLTGEIVIHDGDIHDNDIVGEAKEKPKKSKKDVDKAKDEEDLFSF